MPVRVRYAPSPTGSPHVGNIRTALFDYLLAQRHGGSFMVRIEDTDSARFIPGCEEEILESLRWIGMKWDEGPDVGGPQSPYRQSERAKAGIYSERIQKLLEAGHAYKAFDTPEELEEMRQIQQANRQPVGYFGGEWRDASPEKVAAAERVGKPFVIRLKMPRGRTLVCNDAIRGPIAVDSDTVDDQVLIKADGMPTYHCAAVLDDHLMSITHIIRGEEWISSAPKHVWLFEAFGWEPPVFVHVPVINGPDGKKLSKRHGDTRCLDYRAAGYLPEALANFIALIGWAPGGDREIMSMDEMAAAFDLSGLQPSPGVFDLEKLRWMNGQYIRNLDPDDLFARVKKYLESPETAEYWMRPETGSSTVGEALLLLRNSLDKDETYTRRALMLARERVVTLADFSEACTLFFVDEPAFEDAAVKKWFGEKHVPQLLQDVIEWLESHNAVAGEIEAFLRAWAESHGFEKLGPIVHPVRVALTGKMVGPGLFELMEVLGKERMIRRLKRATENLW